MLGRKKPLEACGVVVAHFDAGLLQRPDVAGRQLEHRQGEVHQQPHTHPFPRFAGQGLRDQTAGGVDLVDEELQLHRLAGGFDELEALGQRVKPHIQQSHGVRGR
jgi:hypothetical protein